MMERSDFKNWFVSEKIEHGCCWEASVCAVVESGSGNYGGDVLMIAECGKTHASLISAAHDLLEALEEFIEEYVASVNSTDWGFWDAEEEPKMIKARAAIKKALGE